jgi:alcohol dehydrogenase class IV
MSKDIAWYENPNLKNLFIKAASNAMRGWHQAICSPKITFVGTNSLIDFSQLLASFLGPEEKRVLIITDKGVRKLAERVADELDTLKKIDSKIFDNVLPDVPKYTVMECVEVCKEYDPKVIIAVGGGSAMDTAKMVLLFYERPSINLNQMMVPSYQGLRKKVYWLVAIPTTSGTGAETTFIAVVNDTDRDPPKKTEAVCYELCPDYVILHPDFVKTMPPFLTMGTGMDALAHSVGSYLLTMSSPLTDICNLKAIELILKYLPRAIKRGNDMEAREKMQMAAYIAGIGFGNVSAGVEHSLGHALGALFHVHHGVGVGIYLCNSVAFQAKVTDRFKDLAKVFGIKRKGKNNDELLRDLLMKIQEFMKMVGCPLGIKELTKPEISKEDYMGKMDLLVDYAFNDYATLSSTRKLNPPEIRKIYEIAYENKIDDLMELFYK